jgi:hypothetical protein
MKSALRHAATVALVIAAHTANSQSISSEMNDINAGIRARAAAAKGQPPQVVHINENVGLDGRALEREIAERGKMAEQASQGSGCSADAAQAANSTLGSAETNAANAAFADKTGSRLATAGHWGMTNRAVAATGVANDRAQAEYNSARMIASNPCDPGVAQQAKAARAAAEARINAANAAEEDRIKAARAAAQARLKEAQEAQEAQQARSKKAQEAQQASQLDEISRTLDDIKNHGISGRLMNPLSDVSRTLDSMKINGVSANQTDRLNKISGTLDDMRNDRNSRQLNDISSTVDSMKIQTNGK